MTVGRFSILTPACSSANRKPSTCCRRLVASGATWDAAHALQLLPRQALDYAPEGATCSLRLFGFIGRCVSFPGPPFRATHDGCGLACRSNQRERRLDVHFYARA